MSNERTFTITGMADFLAPEIIQGQGHSLASDWCVIVIYIRGHLRFIYLGKTTQTYISRIRISFFDVI